MCLQIKEARAIDLREYLPTKASMVYVNGNGDIVSAQVWDTVPYKGKYKKLWHTKLKGCGQIRKFGKYSFTGTEFKLKAIQPMLICKNGKVIELGGYRDGKVISYSKDDQGSGLYWSGRGGVGYTPYTNEVEISTGGKAYSRTRLLYEQPSFDVLGKTYSDVAVIMFEHGTKNSKKVKCDGIKPFKDYNSYVSIFWLAKGVGIIQQVVVSIEDGKTFWGMGNCTGNSVVGGESFTTYLR